MQAVIRLAVCLALSTASAAVFADGDGRSAAPEQQPSVQQSAPPRSEATMTTKEGAGAGSGEPRRSAKDAGSDRRDDASAIEEYRHQQFLNEVWTRP